jgi:hypothetical protein
MKALRKEIDERYQTIKQLESDLKKLKQRLEFETELERSIIPESATSSLNLSKLALADTEIGASPATADTKLKISSKPNQRRPLRSHAIRPRHPSSKRSNSIAPRWC